MAVLMALTLLVSSWAYTLEDQSEPQVLTLRTQVGTYRVQPLPVWECSFVLANENVEVLGMDDTAMQLRPQTEDWAPTCTALIVGQVDDKPCFMNAHGDCDVSAENA